MANLTRKTWDTYYSLGFMCNEISVNLKLFRLNHCWEAVADTPSCSFLKGRRDLCQRTLKDMNVIYTRVFHLRILSKINQKKILTLTWIIKTIEISQIPFCHSSIHPLFQRFLAVWLVSKKINGSVFSKRKNI